MVRVHDGFITFSQAFSEINEQTSVWGIRLGSRGCGRAVVVFKLTYANRANYH
jgi:hypothetical protein